MLALFQRVYEKESWPLLQLPQDESVVCHAAANAVNFYDPADPVAGERPLPGGPPRHGWSDVSGHAKTAVATGLMV